MADLLQIIHEQRGRIEYLQKMLNTVLGMMQDTNATMKYVAEKLKEEDHDYLKQLEEEHLAHKV